LTPDAVVCCCAHEKHTYCYFPTLGPSSRPAVVVQPDERQANKTASVLGVVWQTQSVVQQTSGSNEEEECHDH